MLSATDDLRIHSLRPLIAPAILMEEIEASSDAISLIASTRQGVADVLDGRDDRMVVVVGPCSIHDPAAGVEYARRLLPLIQEHQRDLLILMRVYFEKPRTTVGWKGLINDPNLDGSFSINKGLRTARGLLRDIAELGVTSATEFLDPLSPQFLADLVAWAAIGARTSESQVHRELASGLSMPVGFKNGTGGNVQIAVDAIRSASNPHHFLSVSKQGLAAIVATGGNPHCHVILRGGAKGPNYSPADIEAAQALLGHAKLPQHLMVDCSHANSQKDHNNQPKVCHQLAQQVSHGSKAVFGVMIESFLVAGKQELGNGKDLTFGQSVTDACVDFSTTIEMLQELAAAVRSRRALQ